MRTFPNNFLQFRKRNCLKSILKVEEVKILINKLKFIVFESWLFSQWLKIGWVMLFFTLLCQNSYHSSMEFFFKEPIKAFITTQFAKEISELLKFSFHYVQSPQIFGILKNLKWVPETPQEGSLKLEFSSLLVLNSLGIIKWLKYIHFLSYH